MKTLLAILSVSICSVFLFACNTKSSMKSKFEAASTPKEELAAALELNQNFKQYTVTFFDRDGAEIKPQYDGAYDSVDSVRVDFANSDISGTRKILNRDSLGALTQE